MEITNVKLSAHRNLKTDIMLPAAQIQLWRMNFKPLKTPLYCYSRQGGVPFLILCFMGWMMRADMGNISWRQTGQAVSLSYRIFNRLSQNLRLKKWRHLWTLWRQQSDTVQPGWAANLKLSMACFNRHPSGRPLAFGLLSSSSYIHSGCLERVW